MDILISRILKYLNGCLDNDYMYKIGCFIVKNYTKICHYSLNKLLEEGQFQECEVLDFCKHLGFHNFDDFKQTLMTVSYTHLDVYKRQRIYLPFCT